MSPPALFSTPKPGYDANSDMDEATVMPRLPDWLSNLFKLQRDPQLHQARALLSAIDAGGMPLNPARINEIARNFGLEVSGKAPVSDTIRRIRAAVGRASA